MMSEPGAVDDVVGWFRGREEGEVRDDARGDEMPGQAGHDGFSFVMAGPDRPSVFDNKTSSTGNVAEEEGVVGEAGGGPLGVVAVGAHDALGGLEDGPQGREVRRCSRTNYHLS